MQHSYLDKYSGLDSLIHGINPGIKIITFFSFVLFIIFTKPDSFMAFGFYAILIATLILLSRIPAIFILKRSLVIMPFVLMIAVFIPFFKPGKVIGGYSLGSLRLTISYDGLMVLWNILAKSYLSTLCMILLISSTSFSDLMKALDRFGFLKIITATLSFMYRYIFVVQDELMMMKQAKEARSIGGSKWFHARVMANMAGVLFIKTYERAEFVYLAMCSRGFDGNFRTITDHPLIIKDLLFFLTIIMALTGVRILNG